MKIPSKRAADEKQSSNLRIMRAAFFNPVCYLFLSVILFPLFISCTHSPKEIGAWQEIGKTATLEFMKDNSFRAVDDMGMAVSGNYSLDADGNAKFEIIHKGASPEVEVIDVIIMLQGDELTIKFPDTGEVEKYKRER